MSILTFTNNDIKENGQSLAVAAIATQMAITHNYKILIISTDYNDSTLYDSFFSINRSKQVKISKLTVGAQGALGSLNADTDIASGMEGLIRIFSSNRASGELLKNYAKPILNERLDILPGPKTKDFKEYRNLTVYFSQIAEVANSIYDIVFVDLNTQVPKENKIKLFNMSTLILHGIRQNYSAIMDFNELKLEDEFYRKSNLELLMGNYDVDSKFSNKNVARILKEKKAPYVVPYNVLFADYCSEGKIVDYLLDMQKIIDTERKDYIFLKCLNDTVQAIDYRRQSIELGM